MFLKSISFSVALLISSLSFCSEWTEPDGDVKTIYYQGMSSSQTQVAKLTGSRGFIATTGERVVCPRGIDVIKDPYIGHEIQEIRPKRVGGGIFSTFKRALLNPFKTAQECISSWSNRRYGIKVEKPDVGCNETIQAHSIDFGRISVGQEVDIAEHKQRYDECVAQHSKAPLILYGVSRGAATTFNAAACNGYDPKKIKLIVLEGCFDDVRSVLARRWYTKLWTSVAHNLLSRWTKHKTDGLSPIGLVNQFPENVPVAFITSAKDADVPMECTINVSNALAARGKNPVYRLALQHSSHSGYALEHEEDRSRYLTFMHSLYKRLNLPHIEHYAAHADAQKVLEAARLN